MTELLRDLDSVDVYIEGCGHKTRVHRSRVGEMHVCAQCWLVGKHYIGRIAVEGKLPPPRKNYVPPRKLGFSTGSATEKAAKTLRPAKNDVDMRTNGEKIEAAKKEAARREEARARKREKKIQDSLELLRQMVADSPDEWVFAKTWNTQRPAHLHTSGSLMEATKQSWTQLVSSCGGKQTKDSIARLTYRKRHDAQERERIFTEARAGVAKLAARLGRAPTCTEWRNMKEPEQPHPDAIIKYFNTSWNGLMLSLGYKPNSAGRTAAIRHMIPAEEAAKAIYAEARRRKATLKTLAEFVAQGTGRSPLMITKRWSTWHKPGSRGKRGLVIEDLEKLGLDAKAILGESYYDR